MPSMILLGQRFFLSGHNCSLDSLNFTVESIGQTLLLLAASLLTRFKEKLRFSEAIQEQETI